MFCKVLTHGNFIPSKKDFITDTRRPGIRGSDFLIVVFYYCFFVVVVVVVFFIALAFCLQL